MSNRSTPPTLRFTDGIDERYEFEVPIRGVFEHVVAVFSDGREVTKQSMELAVNFAHSQGYFD
jgi:hypothetical protein